MKLMKAKLTLYKKQAVLIQLVFCKVAYSEKPTDREVTIYDYSGKVMVRKMMNGADRQITIGLVETKLASGVYMVSVKFAKHVQTKQLVVIATSRENKLWGYSKVPVQ